MITRTVEILEVVNTVVGKKHKYRITWRILGIPVYINNSILWDL